MHNAGNQTLLKLSGRKMCVVSWLYPVYSFFFFLRFWFPFISLHISVYLCSPFYWFCLVFNGFFSLSLFCVKHKPYHISIWIEVLRRVKRNRFAVRLSWDKSPVTVLIVRKSLGYNELPPSSPRSPQALIPVWQKEGDNCIDLHLKFHGEKKHFGFLTLRVSMHV